jgi:hypothetical protein
MQVDPGQLGVVVQHALKVGGTVQYAWFSADSPASSDGCELGSTLQVFARGQDALRESPTESPIRGMTDHPICGYSGPIHEPQGDDCLWN